MAVPSLESLSLIHFSSEIVNESITHLGLNVLAHREQRETKYDPLPLEGWRLLRERISKRLDDCDLLPKPMKCQIWHVVRKLYSSMCRNYRYYQNDHRKRSLTCWMDNDSLGTRSIGRITFSFNAVGQVDRSKLLECYIETYLANDATRIEYEFWFRFACESCLSDCIMKMFLALSEKKSLDRIVDMNNPLQVYWYSVFRGEECTAEALRLLYADVYDNENSPCANFFRYATHYKKEGAAVHFWYKLTESEKVKFAPLCAKFACRENLADLLYSALTFLNKEQEQQLLQDEGAVVLCHLLEWPSSNYLFSIMNSAFQCFTIFDYILLFERIVEEIMLQPGEHNPFLIVLKKFWDAIPCHIKHGILKNIRNCNFKSLLFAQFLVLLKEIPNDVGLESVIGDLHSTIHTEVSGSPTVLQLETSEKTVECIIKIWRETRCLAQHHPHRRTTGML